MTIKIGQICIAHMEKILTHPHLHQKGKRLIIVEIKFPIAITQHLHMHSGVKYLNSN